jgi:hypothetical protein
MALQRYGPPAITPRPECAHLPYNWHITCKAKSMEPPDNHISIPTLRSIYITEGRQGLNRTLPSLLLSIVNPALQTGDHDTPGCVLSASQLCTDGLVLYYGIDRPM